MLNSLEQHKKILSKKYKHKLFYKNKTLSRQLDASTVFSQKNEKSSIKPFIKWVGGKRSALDHLIKRVPQQAYFNQYFESFVGGGALFFKLKPKRAHLYDINSKLIITYKVIKKNVNSVIKELEKHNRKHSKEYYMNIRDKFNKESDPLKLAGYFIYLNKTCFNGLYRVNKLGGFNVPMGSYKNPCIVDKSNLENVSKLLQNVEIEEQHFNQTKIVKNAFYYFDPPYHTTYDQYDENKFGEEDHKKLRDFCNSINNANSLFMVSNSNTKFIQNLYKGYCIEKVCVGKSVSCKSTGRTKENELIIRNYE